MPTGSWNITEANRTRHYCVTLLKISATKYMVYYSILVVKALGCRKSEIKMQ